MEERKKEGFCRHSMILENREKLNISGIAHVSSFNSEVIVLQTAAGTLTIKGQDLDVSKLNIEDGNISVKGTVYSLAYSDDESFSLKGAGFLSRMFK